MHPPRVLVVDDDRATLRVFCRFLRHHDYQPIAAASGRQAVAVVRNLQPNLILSDVCMPDIDGIKLLSFLRATPQTARIPCVLYTGMHAPEALLAAASLGLGLDAIYRKGTDLGLLLTTVRRALRSAPSAASRRLVRGPLSIDESARCAWYDGRPIPHLSGRRVDLLCVLMRSEAPLSREALLRLVWPQSDNANIVNVNILRLRRALAPYPCLKLESSSEGFRLLAPSSGSTGAYNL